MLVMRARPFAQPKNNNNNKTHKVVNCTKIKFNKYAVNGETSSNDREHHVASRMEWNGNYLIKTENKRINIST